MKVLVFQINEIFIDMVGELSGERDKRLEKARAAWKDLYNCIYGQSWESVKIDTKAMRVFLMAWGNCETTYRKLCQELNRQEATESYKEGQIKALMFDARQMIKDCLAKKFAYRQVYHEKRYKRINRE